LSTCRAEVALKRVIVVYVVANLTHTEAKQTHIPFSFMKPEINPHLKIRQNT
jgi:hypothetical protein